MLEWDTEEKRWNAMHHPFTSPKEEDIPLMDDPSKFGQIRARAYDVVLNGTETGRRLDKDTQTGSPGKNILHAQYKRRRRKRKVRLPA